MDFPNEVWSAIEQKTLCYSNAQLVKAAQEISQCYRTHKRDGSILVSSDLKALAYSAMRMPATFAAIYDCLEKAFCQSNFSVQTLTDIGAGTGAASWAAEMFFHLQRLVCIEREESMLRLGKELMQCGSDSLRHAQWLKEDVNACEIPESDVTIASYILNEISEVNRIPFAEKLWNSAHKALIVIEPGTPYGFENIKKIRSFLLAKNAHIIAPCPHENQCRISENDWCHFTCRVARCKLHKRLKLGEAPYEDEKFSYAVFARQPIEHTGSRVLRHPKIETGRVTLEVCTKDKNEKITWTKRNGQQYKIAKKAKCGDII